LLLGSEVNDDVGNVMVSQMLYLAAADPTADITLYINSPGGSVQAGLAIFDTMQYIPCDVNTVCFGMAASMGAFLLSAGKGLELVLGLVIRLGSTLYASGWLHR
jgi:ATP-dependent Clp protease protease subunit